jgi:hypothetical protein
MSAHIFAVGIVAYLLGKNRRTEAAISPDAGGRGEDNPPFTPPVAEENQFADMDEITWDAVYATEGTGDNPDRYVWKHGVLMGLLYESDGQNLGTDDRHYEYHYIIGNESHTTFVRDSDGTYGHLFNGMAKVYPDEDSAIIEANRLNAPDDGNSPQPDDDDDDTGGIPLQPSTGFGDNYGTINFTDNNDDENFSVIDRFDNDYSDYFGGV